MKLHLIDSIRWDRGSEMVIILPPKETQQLQKKGGTNDRPKDFFLIRCSHDFVI